MMKSNFLINWLIIGLFIFGLGDNHVTIAQSYEKDTATEELSQNQFISQSDLDQLDQLNISYSAFDRSLNNFLIDLEKSIDGELYLTEIDYDSPYFQLREFKKVIRKIRGKLPVENEQYINDMISLVENDLEPIFGKLISNRSNSIILDDVQRLLGIQGDLNRPEHYDYLMTYLLSYLNEKNNELKKFLSEIESNSQEQFLGVEFIILGLLIFWIMFLIAIIVKDKKNNQSLQLEQITPVIKEIRKSITQPTPTKNNQVQQQEASQKVWGDSPKVRGQR